MTVQIGVLQFLTPCSLYNHTNLKEGPTASYFHGRYLSDRQFLRLVRWCLTRRLYVQEGRSVFLLRDPKLRHCYSKILTFEPFRVKVYSTVNLCKFQFNTILSTTRPVMLIFLVFYKCVCVWIFLKIQLFWNMTVYRLVHSRRLSEEENCLETENRGKNASENSVTISGQSITSQKIWILLQSEVKWSATKWSEVEWGEVKCNIGKGGGRVFMEKVHRSSKW